MPWIYRAITGLVATTYLVHGFEGPTNLSNLRWFPEWFWSVNSLPTLLSICDIIFMSAKMTVPFPRKTSCWNSQAFIKDEKLIRGHTNLPKTMTSSDLLRFVLENKKLFFFEENNTNPFANKNEKPSVHEEFINLQIQECYGIHISSDCQ